MFGDVWIELEPNPAAGVEFAEKVVGGSVPKGFFPGIEKGIRETAAEGVLAGFPLIDFKATLYDGSFHPVDSNELSFKIAASMALKDGVLQAKPVLLEPIMTVDVRIPEQYMGEVNRDLNGRRGPRPGHGPRGRDADHLGARPPGRAVLVRDGAAVADRRARDVQLRRSTTTRTCRRTSPRRSSRPTRRSSTPRATDPARPRGISRGSPRGPGARAHRVRSQRPVERRRGIVRTVDAALVERAPHDGAGAARGLDGDDVVDRATRRRTR